MGPKGKGRTGKKAANGKNSSTQITETDINVILAQAEEALAQIDLDTAKGKYIQALQLEPTNTKLMDTLAELLLQLGEIEDAYLVLKKSIELAPTENGMKYLSFAQLHNGEDALRLYRSSVDLLSAALQNSNNTGNDENSQKVIRQQLCSAYCAVAEIFMTDLW
jgi:tetratricopeptide (TPR) repeat protein